MRCAKCGKSNRGSSGFCNKCGAALPAKQKKKHRRLFWTIIAIVVFLLGGIIFIGVLTDRQFKSALADIQNNLVNVARAKSAGDSIVAGKKMEVTMETVQNDSINAAKNLAALSAPDDLKSYQAAAILWSIQVASSTAEKSDWKNLKNQPSDFSLALTDIDAENSFEASVKIIEELKKAGTDAIQKNDREAMLRIGVKILIQNHWLNALLHSVEGHATWSLATPTLAASQDLQVPPVGRGIDVTCSVCNYPDAYKVQWTDKLRQQYGCEVRCQLKTTSTEEQTPTEEEKNAEENAKQYAEDAASYAYSDTKRAICIGNNAGGVFCVEEAVSLTNEIAASAIGFAEREKALSVDEWNNGYKDIDLALDIEPEAPSQPTAAGGHKEGGLGTISQGTPTVTPKPATPKPTTPTPTTPVPTTPEPTTPVISEPVEPEPQGGIWDGTYALSSGNCSCYDTTPSANFCNDDYYGSPVKNYLYVYNDEVTIHTSLSHISSNGYAILHYSGTPTSYTEDVELQFTKTGRGVSVAVKYISIVGGTHNLCTYTGTRE
jgi:hypothetical protein